MKSNIFIPYLLALSIGGVGFGTLAISLTVAIGFSRPIPELFSEYVEVFPGQPEMAAEARGFVCPDKAADFYHDLLEIHCIVQPEAGIFSMVEVRISEGLIRKVTFTLRKNTLNVGDLALFLGTRDFRSTAHTIFFGWQGKQGIASTVVGDSFSFFKHVWQVTFADMPLPV